MNENFIDIISTCGWIYPSRTRVLLIFRYQSRGRQQWIIIKFQWIITIMVISGYNLYEQSASRSLSDRPNIPTKNVNVILSKPIYKVIHALFFFLSFVCNKIPTTVASLSCHTHQSNIREKNAVAQIEYTNTITFIILSLIITITKIWKQWEEFQISNYQKVTSHIFIKYNLSKLIEFSNQQTFITRDTIQSYIQNIHFIN